MGTGAHYEITRRGGTVCDLAEHPSLADARLAQQLHRAQLGGSARALRLDTIDLILATNEHAAAGRQLHRRRYRHHWTAHRRRRDAGGLHRRATVLTEARGSRVLVPAGCTLNDDQPGRQRTRCIPNRLGHLGCRLEALPAVLGKRAGHDVAERARDPAAGRDLTGVGHRVLDVAQHDIGRRVRGERKLLGEQLEEQYAGGVEVTAPVDLLATPLLRRHVVGRTADQAWHRDRRIDGRASHQLGETKVHNLDEVVTYTHRLDDHVLRLEVAVDHIECMGLTERGEDALCDRTDPREGKRTVIVDEPRQVLPVEVLHDEIQDPVIRAAEVDDADTVGMVQPTGGPGLRVEAGNRLLVRQQVRMNDLDRHRATEHPLFGPVDTPHATDTNQIEHDVRARDDASDQRIIIRLIGHRRGTAGPTESVALGKRSTALMAQLHGRQHSGSSAPEEVSKAAQTRTFTAESDPVHSARLRVLLAGANLWVVCVAWPWLFGPAAPGWRWLLAAMPIALLVASLLTLPGTGRLADPPKSGWLLLLAFPGALGVCMAAQTEAINRQALGPFALGIAIASLVAYGAASLSALATERGSLQVRVRAVVPQPWDVPPTPAPRLQLAVIWVGALGSLCIGLWAPAWGGMTRMRQHWGEAAVEGALLTQVVGAALAVAFLAAFVGAGVRSARSPDAPPTLTRFALLLALGLLGGAVYMITHTP